ncbi:hypothetical protein [Cognaticolwellia mytili]|uniref:hypothetical protein n=1 Tax=Cognaticolwellia mytili TaxID=1888913 RepID=UPI000A170728|nr:hypothetical protein [Cognaticolwellia mytili]
MEIQSAFNAGVQGFQKATEGANQAASDIARSTLSDNEVSEPATSSAVTQASAVNEPNGLTESIVNLRVAEVQAQSSAEVIQSADENLGTLIDVRV